mgnify:CR=1 FL=1
MGISIASRDASRPQLRNPCQSEVMLPDLYRSFETATLKDLVSYGDPADEEPRPEGWGGGDEEASPRPRVQGRARRSWSSLRRAKRRWFGLGRRATAPTQLG